nr:MULTISPECIES: glycoside hydrolase family 3 N-terminal domain-containing protein [Microbacterium]
MVFLDETPDLDAPSPLTGVSLRELIVDRGIRFITLGAIPAPDRVAGAIQVLQDLATTTGSRLPIVFATDPRHSFVQNDGASHRAAGVSQWPEPIGLGALADEDLVRDFARIVRGDYRAMGIRMALHPQIDLTTEPRWARQAQSFGATAPLTGRLTRAYLEGLQGDALGADSVAATVKHFPGGGPQQDGEDPHFPYGREQVYPGGRFEDHLAPFRDAIAAGAGIVMPYYGMPVGLELDGEPVEQVGFAFNRQIITGLLREKLGFEGVVISDFGLITDQVVFGKPFPARAWGVEQLSREDRTLKLLHAGVDQFGGEFDTTLVTTLVEDGRLDIARLDESARRIVQLQLRLGLIDPPPQHSAPVLGAPSDVARGLEAQSRVMTVLVNPDAPSPAHLPLTGSRRVHLQGLDASALPAGWVAAEAAAAELAIVRISAPFEPRDDYFLEAGMEQGSLDLPADLVAEIAELGKRMPVVLVVTLTRPAILTPVIADVAAVVADFGASDAAVMRALTGEIRPEGRLPFELPRSMAAVADSRPDVASDSADPLFPAGWSAL